MKLWQKDWVYRFGIMILVAVVWFGIKLIERGFGQILSLWPGFLITILLWIVGYQLGWVLVKMDKFMGKLLKGNNSITNLTSQWDMGIRNVVTMGAMAILGVWLVTSSGSYLAWGAVLGLQIRLLGELVRSVDYKKWYQVLNRDFEEREHGLVKLVLVLVTLFQLLMVVQG